MKKLLGLGLGLLVLAACGGSDPPKSSNDIKSTPYPDAKNGAATTTTAAPANDKPTDPKAICADAKPIEEKKALRDEKPGEPWSHGMSLSDANAKKDPYKMADLDALDKKGQYEELLAHVEDIPPAQRDAKWETLVTHAASGYMTSLTTGSGSWEGVFVSQALVKRMPFLAKDKDFMAKRAAAGKVASEQCLQDSYRGQHCIDMMKEFLQTSGTSPDLGLAFAKITRKNQNAYVAVPFFKWAVDQKKDASYCGDEDLSLAVVAGLGLPTDYDNARDSRALATSPCFDALKAAMIKQLVSDGGSYVKDNTCAVLKAKGAL